MARLYNVFDKTLVKNHEFCDFFPEFSIVENDSVFFLRKGYAKLHNLLESFSLE